MGQLEITRKTLLPIAKKKLKSNPLLCGFSARAGELIAPFREYKKLTRSRENTKEDWGGSLDRITRDSSPPQPPKLDAKRAVTMAGFAIKADQLGKPEKNLKIPANKIPGSALS